MDQEKTYHLNLLQSELQRRLTLNPQYSLRSFARDLGVVPSWLSSFLKNQKGLSVKRAKNIAQSLGLSLEETKIFLMSVEAYHGRSPASRKSALEKLKKNKNSIAETKKVTQEEQKKIATWYHLAILELTDVEGFDHSAKWLSQKLKLPTKLVEYAVNDLIEMGWLKIVNGKMLSVFEITESSNDTASDSIKKYHSDVLLKAGQEVYTQPVHLREFQNMTMAFDTKNIKEVKKFIKEFQTEFANRFYSTEASKNSVYQFSIQFFRLDQEIKQITGEN